MNGSGNGAATEEVIGIAADHQPSLDGFGTASSTDAFGEHPELLLLAGVVGGLLLAGLVSRIGR
jgi:hypothetical protein